MNKIDMLKRELEFGAKEYMDEVQEIANREFYTIVKTYCIKNGYTFFAGMGVWAMYDRDGNQLNRSGIDAKVLAVLQISVPLYDHDLGTLMPELE